MFTLEVEKGLVLALVEQSFAPRYFEIVSKEKAHLSQWLAWPLHANSEDFFKHFITRSLLDYAEGKSLVCAMVYEGKVVGNVSLNTISQSLRKAEIGYWLSAEYQGKGIVSKSVSKLINVAFTKLGLEKIEIMAAVENSASRRVAERLGFNLEGVITQAENLNGRFYDHAVYGLNSSTFIAA
ncbi:GNAT family N-acetyltransferase [Shewanella sp. KX20019]|uniref:GNAT family N-acetyltransferase n=1 Tax=Shewanella sp. KX20019 TaxID=2803864 RepID=UPI001925DF29|nr:GNAT family N-acetyltransferase [Shewanella sp. KX20019]QQX79066.1 GNAT family N-acetyltransferase [Shewanella sp. KX20019]